MPREPFLVGIDIGSTNIKAVVFDPTGKTLAHASIPTPTHYPQSEWAHYDPEQLWNSTKHVLKQAIHQLEDANPISSIAVASIGETGVPLDRQGNPTFDAIAWYDMRARHQALWLERTIGRDQLFKLTGLSLQPIFGLCKILWIKENHPDAFSRTVTWLNTADYIAYRLSGVARTDYSLASRTLAFDLQHRCWADDFLGEIGVSPSLFAPLSPSGTALGAIDSSVARETGIPQHTQISTGGHDHICGALATGVTIPGTMLNSLGTAEGICVPLSHPISDPELGRMGYTVCAHVAPDSYYVLAGLYTSGACIDWLREILGENSDYDTLIREADAVPPGSGGVHFLPHLRLANPPQDDPRSKGAFVGLNTDVKRGQLFRSVLEGLAFESRLTQEKLFDHPEITPLERIYVVGGGMRNSLHMTIKASVQNRTITIADIDEATALGAGVLGGLGADVYTDLSEALATIQFPQIDVDPDPELAEFYDTCYQTIHKKLYPTVRKLHHTIDGVVSSE